MLRCRSPRWFASALCFASIIAVSAEKTDRRADEALSFQTHQPWSPRINLDADVAMVYGIDPSLPERMESWRQHGYQVQVMTGVAWGQYQDYLNGQYDGSNHWDEAQTDRYGKIILHGGSKDVPYIAPGTNYGRYLMVGVKLALDAGAQAIYLEEPEFWARAGWSASFQREWKAHYGEPWQPPDSSPDAQYRASKLKYFLYRRALEQVFHFVRDYGAAQRRMILCYVPTHSLLNYAHWRIVSPESSLIGVGADGYIAQVWTGTARTANVYEGRRRERTFETAYLEYSAMQNLVRASGRRVWYLNDPIEDDPNHSWDDYRKNWESTLTASLLQPEVWRYEIMPWPERIFNGKYPVREVAPLKTAKELEKTPAGTGLAGFGRLGAGQRAGIPQAYATELQTVIHALGEMKQPPEAVQWQQSGTQGIGVLVSDTMMFERADPSPSDPNLGSFYGLAMPLIKRGIPVEPVQIESAIEPGFLSRYRVLLLTYEGQKPPTPQFHEALAQWVREGGALVVVDEDRDPYNQVREWWNQSPLRYQTPREHLFEKLGLAGTETGLHRVGGGVVLHEAESPASLSYRAEGADSLRKWVRRAAEGINLPWKESNALVLRRGPYLVAAGLDESVPGPQPLILRGRLINLFDPNLPVLSSFSLNPGTRALLLDLNAERSQTPKVLAAACRIRNERFEDGELRFESEGIADTQAVVRVSSPHLPASVLIGARQVDRSGYDSAAGSVRLHFSNSAKSVPVVLRFRSVEATARKK